MIHRIIKGIIISTLTFFCYQATFAGSITVAQIAQYGVQAVLQNPVGNYLDYRIEGICTWMKCSGLWCTFATTPYVREYLPDVVISVYKQYGDNPFVEGNQIDKAEQAAGQAAAKAYFGDSSGSGRTGSTKRGLLNRFYQVDVIGNPAIWTIDHAIPFIHIKSAITPYAPYFSSLSDVISWRTPMAEEAIYPENLIPFVRDEGMKLAPWGSIFPRDGFVTQGDGYKAAAVMAIRGGTIVTGQQAPHVGTGIRTGSCGWDDCTISPIKENDNTDVKFERIYPDATTSYDPNDFGHNDLTDVEPYGSNYAKDGDDNYAFLAWRKYEGCVEGPGHVIKVVRW